MNSLIQLPSVFPVTCHTDYVGQGTTFVAIQGFKENGTAYIKKAILKGARTIVIANNSLLDQETINAIQDNNIDIIRVENTRKALAHLSAQAAHNPADQLQLFAITGTKGKSTTAFLLEHILKKAGYKTALLTTVHNKILDTHFVAPLTTAQPDYLHQFFKVCVEQGVTHVVMEVAAQAVTMHRTDGLMFEGIVFTNFSREHLEFYATLEDYFLAKSSLLVQARTDAPVIVNQDDAWCRTLPLSYIPFGLTILKNYTIISLEHARCIELIVEDSNRLSFVLTCPILFGEYNGYNVLAALTMAFAIGIDIGTCAHALDSFEGVPGRLEQYTLPNGARCIIDCAHNPSSYQALLSTLRLLTSHLIVVFGAGGDRDPGRRPQMGAIAAHFADHVLITSDNPRTEDPMAIVQDIIGGIDESLIYKIIIEPDRHAAIQKAYSLSDGHSVIALLGKADGDYQIIGNQKIPFSERAIIKELSFNP